MELLSSRENPQIKRLVKLLTQKKVRDELGLFAVEGSKLSVDALQSGVPLTEVYCTSSAQQRYPQCELLRQKSPRFFHITEELALRISENRTPQGVFCVFQKPDLPQDAIALVPQGKYLLLSSLQDPGNLGAVVRSAEAFGVDGLLLSSDCPDLYSPKVLRGSMGGIFRVPVSVWNDMAAAVLYLQGQGTKVYAAALQEGAVPVAQVDFSGSRGVLIGNEGAGLSSALAAACDASVILPMAGKAESLNAAVAAGIFMWELCGRQK